IVEYFTMLNSALQGFLGCNGHACFQKQILWPHDTPPAENAVALSATQQELPVRHAPSRQSALCSTGTGALTAHTSSRLLYAQYFGAQGRDTAIMKQASYYVPSGGLPPQTDKLTDRA